MKRVLMIEDDRWLAEIYRDVLENSFDMTVAHDVAAAFDAIENKLPDVVLLDIMLPGDNGISFLQEFRSYADTIDIPVLVCSSTRFADSQRAGFAAFSPIKVVDKASVTPHNLAALIAEVEARRHAPA